MASVLENSEPAMQIENNLFDVPATFTDRWRTENERINPTTILTDDGTAGDINFFIPPSTSGLLSLADVCLELEVAIKVRSDRGDWTFIKKEDGVAPTNNFIHSLFQAVHVSVANRMLSDASTFYPYRAYLESLLNYTAQAQVTQLSSSAFYMDTASMFNDEKNPGEAARKQLFTRDSYVQLSGKLFCDIFQQNKPLVTGIPVSVRLVMSRPEFSLRVYDTDKTKSFKAFIRNPRLLVRRFVPAPDYLLAMSHKLLNNTAKYHVERVVMRVSDIARGTQSTVISNLQIGQLPKVAFIGLVAADDFHGKSDKNPYFFQHFGLNQLSVEVDGQSYPTKPYVADFGKHQHLECYDGLLDTLGRKCQTYGEFCVDREEYAQGYTVFGFDLTSGATGRGPLSLIRQGNLSVALAFSEPLPQTIMMVCMLIYDSIIEINQHRQIIADFTT